MTNNINRTSDFNTYNTAMESTQKTLRNYSIASSQLATGQVASTNLEIADQSFELTESKNILEKNNQYLNTTGKCTRRLDATQGQVDTIRKTLIEFRAKLTQALSNGGANTDFSQFCSESLNIVAKALNSVNAEGLNNFGGPFSQGLICDLTQLPDYILGQPASTLYAIGDNSLMQADIDQNLSIIYGVPACDQGIAETLQCLQIGANNAPSENQNSLSMKLLHQCMTISAQADKDLNATISTILTKKEQILNQQQYLQEENTKIDEEISDISDINPVEPYAKLIQLDAQSKIEMFTLKRSLTNLEDLMKRLD